MNVISFDPGGTTGVAWWCDKTGFHAEEVEGGFSGLDEWIDRWYSAPVPDVVTYESFTIRQNTHRLDPVAFEDTTSNIGIIRSAARAFGASCFKQSPAEAKSFATNDKLRTAGFWTPTTGGHANDSARHLLVRCMKLRIPEIMERFL